MKNGKIAVLIYPDFSLQEITCLTSCLTVWFGESIDIIASERKEYTSEDGFKIILDKTVDEIEITDYSCVIFPGTINPLPALFDERLISFLEKIREADVLFAAISSAPILLLRSGILKDKDYTAGFFMQMAETFDFVDKEHFIHKPVVEDGNVITAIGMFFREFAEAVLKKLGYDTGNDFMLPKTQNYSEEELTFYWTEEEYKEFLEELKPWKKA